MLDLLAGESVADAAKEIHGTVMDERYQISVAIRRAIILLKSAFDQEIAFGGMVEEILSLDIDAYLCAGIIQLRPGLRFVFVNLIFLETFIESQSFGDREHIGHHIFIYSVGRSRGWWRCPHPR